MTNNNFLFEKDGWVCALAPAKVNLFLHITGRRADGYHELESVFAFTKFGDNIKIRPADKLSLKIAGEFSEGLNQENSNNNLVMKAAYALYNYMGEDDLGAEMILEKNLPIASGIGGGSSDAAATLRALIKLWNVEISQSDLMDLALGLGADVPACLTPQTSFVSGIGENVMPIDLLKGLGCVLVNAGDKLSTAEVFRAHRDMNIAFSEPQNHYDKQVALANLKGYNNDLFKPACSIAPKINEMISEINNEKNILVVRMSGSGATCFGLTGSLEHAEQAAKAIKKTHQNWWVRAGEFF